MTIKRQGVHEATDSSRNRPLSPSMRDLKRLGVFTEFNLIDVWVKRWINIRHMEQIQKGAETHLDATLLSN